MKVSLKIMKVSYEIARVSPEVVRGFARKCETSSEDFS